MQGVKIGSGAVVVDAVGAAVLVLYVQLHPDGIIARIGVDGDGLGQVSTFGHQVPNVQVVIVEEHAVLATAEAQRAKGFVQPHVVAQVIDADDLGTATVAGAIDLPVARGGQREATAGTARTAWRGGFRIVFRAGGQGQSGQQEEQRFHALYIVFGGVDVAHPTTEENAFGPGMPMGNLVDRPKRSNTTFVLSRIPWVLAKEAPLPVAMGDRWR